MSYSNRKRSGGIQLEDDAVEADQAHVSRLPDASSNAGNAEGPDDEINGRREEKNVEEERKKADSLWADFMKDVGSSKPKPVGSAVVTTTTKLVSQKPCNTIECLLLS